MTRRKRRSCSNVRAVSNVVDLAEARDRRVPAPVVPAGLDHPALRYVAGRAFYIAHRREEGKAACGAKGALVLAPPGVPLCVDCYDRSVEAAQ